MQVNQLVEKVNLRQIFIFANNQADKTIELKISFKKENADFLENKTNAERAEQLFGCEWAQIIMNSTMEIRENLLARPLIYKQKFRRTEMGAITLGWKFELLNKPGGDLSGRINLTRGGLTTGALTTGTIPSVLPI